MTDPEIRQQTASEPLSLEEEHDMQRSWHLDDDKLTFIVLSRDESVYVPDTEADADEVSQFLAKCKMAGDVNLFLSPSQDEDEDEETAGAGKPSAVAKSPAMDAELEVMIAEPSERRKGLAREALSLLIHYASTSPTPVPSVSSSPSAPSRALPLQPRNFLVKIGLDNAPSLALFKSLGMQEVKVSEIWREVEMRWADGDGLPLPAQKKVQVLRWKR
ncbi:hypothetical protein FA10DRAFT_265901 [Acaromyces ingoldii]|uniref:N-acetyltransferase domain-containing protein n=1 Tax=Acaromyces ingoldii TaxID=215250 RepID=A0A316YTW0_9BASI|nr:hypothetical protein FA10DRAFT_265901 [Acaromyces ingoldii]PWN92098.1 hypothetical protein FA10DRAFT_265901 [Acaromyces ingoldii]